MKQHATLRNIIGANGMEKKQQRMTNIGYEK